MEFRDLRASVVRLLRDSPDGALDLIAELKEEIYTKLDEFEHSRNEFSEEMYFKDRATQLAVDTLKNDFNSQQSILIELQQNASANSMIDSLAAQILVAKKRFIELSIKLGFAHLVAVHKLVDKKQLCKAWRLWVEMTALKNQRKISVLKDLLAKFTTILETVILNSLLRKTYDKWKCINNRMKIGEVLLTCT